MFVPPGMLPQMMQMRQRYPDPPGKSGAPVEKDLYQLLRVPVTAKEAEIRKAYRELSRKHHPDKGGETQLYQDLTRAHAILSDPEKRACYDAYGSEYEKIPNIQLFVQELRPDNLEITLRLSTRECLKGKQTTLNYRRMTGPGASQMASVNVNVPVNVPDGHRLIFHGQGTLDADKPLPGHLVVVVVEQPTAPGPNNSPCKRVGGPNGLVLFRKSVTLAEAVCGGPIDLELPDGSHTTFVTNVVRPGQWYVLEGTTPTMYVMFEVDFPTELTAAQQEELRRLFHHPLPEHENHVRSHLAMVPREVLDQKVATAQQQAAEEESENASALRSGGGGGPGGVVQECRTQ